MRKFSIDRDPCGFRMYEKGTVSFEPGVTILTGCNGAGKTTLLRTIENKLQKEHVPVMSVSNLLDGGTRSIGHYLLHRQFETAAQLPGSSEGEIISITLSRYLREVHRFILTGEDGMHPEEMSGLETSLSDLAGNREEFERMQEKAKKDRENSKERWLLLDGCDSGYSIDNMIDLKEVFSMILSEGKEFGKDIYILAAANSYELAEGQRCLDVMAGTYYTPKSYASYRKRILKTREKKNARVYSSEEQDTRWKEARKKEKRNDSKGIKR